jgi:hypothetical protein
VQLEEYVVPSTKDQVPKKNRPLHKGERAEA